MRTLRDQTELLSDLELEGSRHAERRVKNRVDPARPYAYLLENERADDGRVEPVATLFLTNRECPFRCLFCDLWKNTTDDTVPAGAIPAQIDDALSRLPAARHIKLYNSGNFFDPRAIPSTDLSSIAARMVGFRTVIVENHPRLCGDVCLRFRDQLPADCEFEIAMGLETIHPNILPRLQKQMSLDDFSRACEFLLTHGIHIRAFVLLNPPLQVDEEEGVAWAIRSAEWAFGQGVRCCCVIPTRGGNRSLERLAAQQLFIPPRLRSLEQVLETLLTNRRQRAFVDTWDLERFSSCSRCFAIRQARLVTMNLTQMSQPSVLCDCESPA